MNLIFQGNTTKTKIFTFPQDMDGHFHSVFPLEEKQFISKMNAHVALPLVMMIPDARVLRKSRNAAHRRSSSMTVRICHTFWSIF